MYFLTFQCTRLKGYSSQKKISQILYVLVHFRNIVWKFQVIWSKTDRDMAFYSPVHSDTRQESHKNNRSKNCRSDSRGEDSSSTITKRRLGHCICSRNFIHLMGLESMILCKLKKIYQGFILIKNFKRVYLEKSFLKFVDILFQKLMYRSSQILHTLLAYKIISHNDLFLKLFNLQPILQ